MCLIASFNRNVGRSLSVRERARQTLLGAAQRRFYNSFQVRGDLGLFQPKDLTEALEKVDEWADKVKSEIGRGSLDKLQLFVRNEFSMYSGDRPASHSDFAAIVERFQMHAKDLPPGVVWCPGTIPYETGEMFEGRKAGFNSGMIFEGGTGDKIIYNKMIASDMDKWDYSVHHVSEESGQARLVRVRDPNGGSDAILSMRICLEFSKYPVEKPFPQFVVVPSMGTSSVNDHVPNLDCQLVLCNFEEPLPKLHENDRVFDDYGVFVMEPKPSKFKKLKIIESKGEEGQLGGLVKLLLYKCSQSFNQLQDWLERPEVKKVSTGGSEDGGHHGSFSSGVLPLRELSPEDLAHFRDAEREGKFMEWRPIREESGHHGEHHR